MEVRESFPQGRWVEMEQYKSRFLDTKERTEPESDLQVSDDHNKRMRVALFVGHRR